LITILDPHFKLDIFKKLEFNKDTIDSIRNYLDTIYKSYKDKLNNNINLDSNNIQSSFNSSLNLDNFFNNSTDSKDELYISNNYNKHNNNNIENEIDLYLSNSRVSKDITIENYYNTNKSRLSIIYKIARDYLAILGTSTPSKATFSKVSNIVAKSRNRLLASTIKKLIILKELKVIEEKEETVNDNLLFKENTNIRKINKNKQRADNIDNIDSIDQGCHFLVITKSYYALL
jgi:hypothetical protein